MVRKKTAAKVKATFESEGYTLLGDYQDADSPLISRCPKGHEYTVKWKHFRSGNRCKTCQYEAKRLSPDFVKAAFESEGYTLLDNYKRNTQKLRFFCPEGHKYSMTWKGWQKGHRCSVCAGHVVTRKQVKDAVEAEGYQLLGKYKRTHDSIPAICPKGHKTSITWSSFQGGVRCKICASRKNGDKKFLTFDYVKSEIERKGFKLLDNEYANSNTKLNCLCPKGHEIQVSWNSIQQGGGCKKCAIEKNAKRCRAGSQALNVITTEGYSLLSEYVNNRTNLDLICPNGHECQICLSAFKRGKRCSCDPNYYYVTQERVEASFSEAGYTLLDIYKGKNKKLRFICPEGHKYSISWDSWSQGARCAICSGHVVTRRQVKDAFNAEGYTLLSKYSNDSQEKLDFICPNGHNHSIRWANFQQGKRCIYCSKSAPVDSEEVKKEFKLNGYRLLNSFTNSSVKLEYACPEGHEGSVLWGSFKRGARCAICRGMVVTHEEVEKEFSRRGYTLLNKYEGSNKRLEFVCPNGHQHSTVWASFRKGHGCAICAGHVLTEEDEEVKKLKLKIRGQVYGAMQRRTFNLNDSKSTFSNRIAKNIYESLGPEKPGFHLDHIVPQSFFDFRIQKEIEACWNVNNLRWLEKNKNISRGNRLTLKEVESFSKSQLKILAAASRRPKKFNKMLKNKLS